MQITNTHNLPIAIYKVVCAMTRRPVSGQYSCTELITPPQMRYLKIKHWKELTEDASERLWALLGAGVHSSLENIPISNALQEEQLQIKVSGITLTGRPDILHGESLEDYKVTSVYSFLLGDKPEWTAQLNIYAQMFRWLGFTVSSAKIHAILRDWMESKSHTGDYPSIPFQSINIKLLHPDIAAALIHERIKLHMDGEQGRYEPCTDVERWYKGTKYAVKRRDRKRAIRVLDTLEEAEAYLFEEGKQGYIEERKGEYIRCERFCIVAPFCEQFKREPAQLTEKLEA